MARIKTSALISDISGKVNGSVFQRNQGGLVMRNESGKINSNTIRSNTHKVNLVSVQGAWLLLSNAERLQWQSYATYLNKKQKKNPTLSINGHQLFINVNTVRYDMLGTSALFSPPILTTPTLTPLPQPISIVTIVINFGDITITLDRAVTAANESILLFMSRPLRATQMSANQKMVLMKTSTQDGLDFIPTSYYEEVYGRKLISGEYVQTKMAIYDNVSNNYSAFSHGRFEVG